MPILPKETSLSVTMSSYLQSAKEKVTPATTYVKSSVDQGVAKSKQLMEQYPPLKVTHLIGPSLLYCCLHWVPNRCLCPRNSC